MVFPVARNARRIFRVLPRAACLLAHLRLSGPRRSAEEGVLQKRAKVGPRDRREGVSRVSVGRTAAQGQGGPEALKGPRGASYNPFPKARGYARLGQFRRGLRFTERFRTGVVSFARP